MRHAIPHYLLALNNKSDKLGISHRCAVKNLVTVAGTTVSAAEDAPDTAPDLLSGGSGILLERQLALCRGIEGVYVYLGVSRGSNGGSIAGFSPGSASLG